VPGHFAQQKVSVQLYWHPMPKGRAVQLIATIATQTVSYAGGILYNGRRFPPVAPNEALLPAASKTRELK
jgi:hypothetical protein